MRERLHHWLLYKIAAAAIIGIKYVQEGVMEKVKLGRQAFIYPLPMTIVGAECIGMAWSAGKGYAKK